MAHFHQLLPEITRLTLPFRDIGIFLHKPSQLFYDSMDTLHMFANPLFHAQTKHVEMDYHFIRGNVAIGAIFKHLCL